MKRILLALLAMASFGHSAALLTGGNINQWPVSRDSSTNQLVIRSIPVDTNGNVITGTATSTITGTVKVDAQGSSIVAYQGTSPWVISPTAQFAIDNRGTSVVANVQGGNLSITSGTLTANQGTAGSAAWPMYLTQTVTVGGSINQGNGLPGLGLGWATNATGFQFLSFTVMTGITTNADSVMSLTWAASTTSGPVFYDINCSGATGVYFLPTASLTTPAGFVNNSALTGYQPCGQISQVPLEFDAGNNATLHMVAVGLSNTSASAGIQTRKRL